MATKTVTITEEAYGLLIGLKSAHESFSHLFVRLAKEKSVADKYFGLLKGDVAGARKRLGKIRADMAKDLEKREDVLFGHQRRS